jgi:hypothetical protein
MLFTRPTTHQLLTVAMWISMACAGLAGAVCNANGSATCCEAAADGPNTARMCGSEPCPDVEIGSPVNISRVYTVTASGYKDPVTALPEKKCEFQQRKCKANGMCGDGKIVTVMCTPTIMNSPSNQCP